jgi:hypothetical protein
LRKGIQVYSVEGKHPSPRGYKSKRVNFFSILFSRIRRTISIKLGKNYHWVKGIQLISNKRPCPLQRGRSDSNKNAKIISRFIEKSAQESIHLK